MTAAERYGTLNERNTLMLRGLVDRIFGRTQVESVEPAPAEWRADASWRIWTLAGVKGYPSPYQHKLVRMMRPGWDKPMIGSPSDLSAAMNVAGLYWQPFEGEIIDGDWVSPSPMRQLGPA